MVRSPVEATVYPIRGARVTTDVPRGGCLRALYPRRGRW